MRNSVFLLTAFILTTHPLRAEENKAATFSTFTVRGQSMRGLLSPGDEIVVDRTYYASHPVLRDDIVTVTKQYFPADIVKQVKVIPGDKLAWKQTPAGDFFLQVNDVSLTNFSGDAYVFNNKQQRLLDLYVKDWKGAVPDDNFLVFGTHVRGTRDSSVFGPVTRVMITGKVVEKKTLK